MSTYTSQSEEEGVHQVFAEHKFYYPVTVTTEELPPLQGFPWIKPSDFLRSLHRMNDLNHLLGGHDLKTARPILKKFWQKYRGCYPMHQLWEHIDSGRKRPEQCLPLFLHGDEGTSFKKGGIFICSFQGAIGFGTSKQAKDVDQNLRAVDEGIPLNFLKTALQTRVLICCCPKD